LNIGSGLVSPKGLVALCEAVPVDCAMGVVPTSVPVPQPVITSKAAPISALIGAICFFIVFVFPFYICALYLL
jgi:hypothetical protein